MKGHEVCSTAFIQLPGASVVVSVSDRDGEVETGRLAARSYPLRGILSRTGERRRARVFALWNQGRFSRELEWYSNKMGRNILSSSRRG